MSKFLTNVFIAVLGILTIAGCVAKKPDLPPFGMSATVGTSGFSTGACIASSGNGSLAIIGKTGENPTMTLAMAGWSGGMGTTVIDGGVGSNAYVVYAPSGSDPKYLISGAITITSISNTDISGTFFGLLTDSTKITDGKFVAERQ